MEGELSHEILTSFLKTKTEEEMMNFYQLDVEGNIIETMQTKRTLYDIPQLPKYLSKNKPQTLVSSENNIKIENNQSNKKQKTDQN